MPTDATETKARILRAAEHLFAEEGYDGVSLRRIAVRADVPLALLHYHFGTKMELYRAVWDDRYAARAARVNAEALAALNLDRPGAEVVTDLVDLFLQSLALMDTESGRDFAQIMVAEATRRSESERGVIDAYLDPGARLMLDAFQTALPHLTRAEVVWRFQAMSGVFAYHAADANRMTRLSDGAAISGDTKAAWPALRSFIIAGWLAPARR